MSRMAPESPPRKTSRFRFDGMALGLLAVLVLECAFFCARHRDKTSLETSLERGTPDEQISALHILAHRNDPLVLDGPMVGQLLSSADTELAEFLMLPGHRWPPRTPEVRYQLDRYLRNQNLDQRTRTRCRFFLKAVVNLDSVKRYLGQR